MFSNIFSYIEIQNLHKNNSSRYLTLGETSKLNGCSLHMHVQQPAAANLYRTCYTLLLKAAAFWLQPGVIDFDFSNIIGMSNCKFAEERLLR